MIRINRIKSVGGNNIPIQIRNLRNDYWSCLNERRKTKANSLLNKAFVTKVLYGHLLTTEELSFINYLKDNIRIIILGDVNTLARIKKEIEYNDWQVLVYNNGTTKFGKKVLTLFGYENRFRSIDSRGIWLAKQLNIKTCPYCNAQYTLWIKSQNSEGKAKFQFDHFYPKDRYPYFSVSLFNLIPSCSNCNHSKSNDDVNLQENYHPYYHSLASFSRFKLIYPANIDKLSFKNILNMDYERELRVKFESKYSDMDDFVNKHNLDFDIDGIYERHKDHAHELLVKAAINDRLYRKSIMKIEGLFPDKMTFKRYFLSNYVTEDDILKRPLAKLYQDISEQLELTSL